MKPHLFPGVRGQVEDEDGEPGDAHAGDDEVDGVEERLPAQGDVEGDVRVGLNAARIVTDAPVRRHRHDVPFDA
ncbi:hypothetical protein TNIN_170281 [Trichonephila inaurata madagascariensis]|uniref:Uncharacterized protein n=1 Tax=Trichonephila inaurata madagascariensis TaxID=2747483 RepID=A0A8X6WVV0_9ARAC|nr:hypothetical protein TNIN_170281 [Trichonephila inaurata madagascariensis]